MIWTKLGHDEILDRVNIALSKNKDFAKEHLIGVPASYLDPKVFSPDSNLLKDAPFLTTLVKNPNHIGCHTMGHSESFFRGTQEIERETIAICAEEILKAEPLSYDGYVASGGTEANIQAIWIYRNYFMREHGAKSSEIALICSEHSHYSMDKAANLLGIQIFKSSVDPTTMSVTPESVNQVLALGKKNNIKYCIVVANMMTTMFGSVDSPSTYAEALLANNMPFKLHVDGAFGGFYYPFSNPDFELNFKNEHVNSVTLDAHKMAQAPYGTGIFIIRKNWMKYATTEEASYIVGEDSTLIGSRSGANAVSIWMILSTYGKFGWIEKIFILQKRTDWLCKQLEEAEIRFYRNPYSNIVTIQGDLVPKELAEEYGLVPDNHHDPKWYKIVVMDHVSIEELQEFLGKLPQKINA